MIPSICVNTRYKVKLNLIIFYAAKKAKCMVLIEYGNLSFAPCPASAVDHSPGDSQTPPNGMQTMT